MNNVLIPVLEEKNYISDSGWGYDCLRTFRAEAFCDEEGQWGNVEIIINFHDLEICEDRLHKVTRNEVEGHLIHLTYDEEFGDWDENWHRISINLAKKLILKEQFIENDEEFIRGLK